MLFRALVVLGFIASSVWIGAAASNKFEPFLFGGIWSVTGLLILQHIRHEVAEERDLDEEESLRPFGSKVRHWSRLQKIFRPHRR